MNFLEERIVKDGIVKEGNVLKVDSFLNHQMDIELFDQIGAEFKKRFADKNINKILLGAGFVNTENLCNLASLVGKTFPYATLPLRFKNADGSPVRAVAMPED